MPRLLTALLALAVAIATLAGCGGGEDRASLAIRTAERRGTAVVVTTECAGDVVAETQPDPAGSGLVEVSLWGSPKVGRCAPEVVLEAIPADQVKVVDAATGQVVDIDPAD